MDLNPNSIEYLILEGAAEVSGIDLETGEAVYTFTDKLEEINPKLHGVVKEYISGSVLSLWVKGYLEIDYFDDDPMVKLTEKAFDSESIALLDQKEQSILLHTIKLFHTDDI